MSSVENKSLQLQRPEFDTILDFIQEGDSLVVTTLSCLCTKYQRPWNSVELLEKKGASLVVLDMDLDMGTPNGRLDDYFDWCNQPMGT